MSATGKPRRLETFFPGWPDTCNDHMRRVRTRAIHTALNQFARRMSYVNVSTTDIYDTRGRAGGRLGVIAIMRSLPLVATSLMLTPRATDRIVPHRAWMVAGRRPVSAVVEDLNAVPVFGIATDNGKLYSTDESGCMVYTHLDDVLRVIAQLPAVYATESLEVQPLELGTVLFESGLLVKRTEKCPPISLVASPEAKREARQLRGADGSTSDTSTTGSRKWRQLAGVPLFHIGAVTWNSTAQTEEAFWPVFFRRSDIETLWETVGAGTALPPVQVTDLAALIAFLREPSTAPAKPMVCASLDAIEYERSRAKRAIKEQGQLLEVVDDQAAR